MTTTTLFATFIKSIKIFLKSPRPSLPLKRAPPLTPTLSPSGEREETAPPCRSEPLRSKDGGPSKVSPDCAGWDRLDAIEDTSSDSASITSVSSAFTTDSSASTALDVVQRELEYLGLWKFAGAVMYVLHEALGLSEGKMIAPMVENRGKLLLAEILNGGKI